MFDEKRKSVLFLFFGIFDHPQEYLYIHPAGRPEVEIDFESISFLLEIFFRNKKSRKISVNEFSFDLFGSVCFLRDFHLAKQNKKHLMKIKYTLRLTLVLFSME